MSVDMRSVPHNDATSDAIAGTPTEPVIALLPRRYDSPDAWALITALYREQLETYAVADDPGTIDPADFEEGVFFVGYVGGLPVACGGLRLLSAMTAEIKRMYVAPGHRGRGIGARLLAALEDAARQSGRCRLVLETGVRNDNALALYGRAGYLPIAPYVEARDPAINRAFSKVLPR